MTSNARALAATNEPLNEEYQTNGAVCIPKLLNEQEIELLRNGIEENLAHPSPRHGFLTSIAIATLFPSLAGQLNPAVRLPFTC